MCNAIERVRTAKPTANILMTTPIRRFNNESGWNPYYDDGTTIPFYKYAEAVYTVANYYGIPVFDLWNNSGIDIKNYTTYMSDTIHPNASGYALFSRELCKFCADGHTGNSMPVIPEVKTTLVDLEDTNITNPQD
jgi:lysophospholipase L1-like esterase